MPDDRVPGDGSAARSSLAWLVENEVLKDEESAEVRDIWTQFAASFGDPLPETFVRGDRHGHIRAKFGPLSSLVSTPELLETATHPAPGGSATTPEELLANLTNSIGTLADKVHELSQSSGNAQALDKLNTLIQFLMLLVAVLTVLHAVRAPQQPPDATNGTPQSTISRVVDQLNPEPHPQAPPTTP